MSNMEKELTDLYESLRNTHNIDWERFLNIVEQAYLIVMGKPL